MKLHAGDLFWEETRDEAPYLTLEGNLDTEVLVVGGGMSGAMIANELTHAGHQVAVVDAAKPGLASSDGNTGIIQYCSDMSLDEMIGKWGQRHAVDFYTLSLEGMDMLAAMVKRVGADVGYRAGHSLYLVTQPDGIKEAQQQEKDGMTELKKRVRQLVGFDVDCYAKLDLEAFVELVDAVGGVDVYMDEPLFYDDVWQDIVAVAPDFIHHFLD